MLTKQDIEHLHRKYAESDKIFELVWQHCEIVAEIAAWICNNTSADVDGSLIEQGALLHDIGVYQVLNDDDTIKPNKHYIEHGVEGYRILKEEKLPEVI